MNIRVEPGTWVVAVSGGVDSVVLLDLMYKKQQRNPQDLTLVVAHFDHGIRPDSAKDRQFVQQLAATYDLPFVYEQANLGAETSEATARLARYDFLEKVRASARARGIITAHHEDDALETAVLNLLRGSGRRGLTALKSTSDIQRPLLQVSKQRLVQYAEANDLRWREDATNTDTKYLRNYVRHNLLSKFPAGKRAQLAILLADMRAINNELDNQITGLLHIQPERDTLDRKWFILLPHEVAREVVHAWLRAHHVKNIDRNSIERTIVAMKTGKNSRTYPIDKHLKLFVTTNFLALKPHER